MKMARYPVSSMIAILVLAFTFFSIIAAGIDETITYKRNDYFYYYFLTDDDIAKAPVISEEYYFEYRGGDGYSPSNTVVFQNSGGAQPLREYLQRLGYKKDARKSGGNEIWFTDHCNDQFYLLFDKTRKEVSLTKIIAW